MFKADNELLYGIMISRVIAMLLDNFFNVLQYVYYNGILFCTYKDASYDGRCKPNY